MPDFTLANFGDTSALTAEQKSAFGEQLVKFGYDADAVKAALAPVEAAEGAQTASITPELSLDANKHPALSDTEKKLLDDNLRRYWTGDPKALAPAARSEGITLDQRTEAERGFDERLGGLTPDEYDLNGLYVNRGILIGEVGKLDTELRGVLSAMKVPAQMGKAIAEEMLNSTKVFEKIKSGPESTLALWRREQNVILERIGGASAEDLTRLAGHALAQMPMESFEALMERGALETANVVLQLARQGERLMLREQMKPYQAK